MTESGVTAPGERDPQDSRLEHLPKPELHVHLDGSLRPATLLELGLSRGIPLPSHDVDELRSAVVADDARSLTDYLRAFDLTVSVMQDAEALERIAFELAEDQATEHIRYFEVRFCPTLNTQRGLAPEQVLEAVSKGLRRGQTAFGVRSSIIVCALRHLPSSASHELAELAVGFREHGVCGFDLAGPEAGHPVRDHAGAFALAHRSGLPITIHAGEAAGPESIREAMDVGHAVRIGHGTRLWEDPELMARARDGGVALEICLTSNVQTGAVSAYEAHPLRRYFDFGVDVTLCTDNRLVSGVTLTDEYRRARELLSFSWDELVQLARNGFSHAFASAEARAAFLGALDVYA
jgi:adenosine deaminase